MVSRLKHSIEQFVRKHDLGQDVQIYSKTEWRRRGEIYGNNAALSITCEGPFYSVLSDGDRPHLRNEFHRVVERCGFWCEQGYSWSAHFYPTPETMAEIAKAKFERHARSSVMRDLGMKRVRGALGGTYYE